jgi:single-strand DNA-binding protein
MASPGMNKVFLLGHLGAPPELLFADSDRPKLKFRMATTVRWKGKNDDQPQEQTDWHNVAIRGNRGRALADILDKGDRVMVEGRIRHHEYEKEGQRRYYTEIDARDIYLTGSRKPLGGEMAPSRATRADYDEPEVTVEN